MASLPTAPPAAPAAPPPPAPPKPRGRWWIPLVAVAVVVIVVAPTLLYVYPGYLRKPSSSALTEGGFTMGQVVTFTYNGSNTYVCTPDLSVMFPGNASAAAAASATECEVGNASQNAVPGQVPEWVLVPGFAGLSVFGQTALGSTSDGFPTVNGSTLLTDCGGGASPSACVDHPTYLYSPFFVAVEVHLGLGGVGGLDLGVLPTPAHDHLINTNPTYPNVPWGTIAAIVLDPNIFPDRATGTCTEIVPSNLTRPTANCLTTLTALDAATQTCSTSVTDFNAAVSNPIWATLNVLTGTTVCQQVVVPGDVTITEVNSDLDSNLYIPFSVSPGAPSSFPG